MEVSHRVLETWQHALHSAQVTRALLLDARKRLLAAGNSHTEIRLNSSLIESTERAIAHAELQIGRLGHLDTEGSSDSALEPAKARACA